MPLFSSTCWNVNICPESHLVSTIKIDAFSASRPKCGGCGAFLGLTNYKSANFGSVVKC